MNRISDAMPAVIPFVWFHGEDAETMVREVAAVAESGLTAFCVESRPFPDFCGETWWQVLDAVMAEAARRHLKVWLLDDKIYPTGYANGAIYRAYPELRQWHLRLDAVDVVGPMENARFLLPRDEESVLLGAFAFRRAGDGIDFASGVELTDRVLAPFARWDVPEGYYQIIFLSKTQGGCERPYYIDMLNPASVDVLLETVYEPHVRRYKSRYPETFCGFFSDEPRFANAQTDDTMPVICSHACTLGVDGMSYPWSDRIADKLRADGFSTADWIGIWRDVGPRTAEMRCRYMKHITDDYGEFFSGRLSDWCHRHGMSYCGHIIEDSGAHARLNCSSGHYFKSMRGADYAGVDVVLHQIKPFFTQLRHLAHISGGYSEPDFFQYTLAKLASSCARIDEEKAGRALCEIFGAYGWGESLTVMLALVHHMLARGVNTFIPHAFSPRFPDEDCPPHFSAQGHYPAQKGFRTLMSYLGELCRFFRAGRTDCRVAVLYHAEAEWSGQPYEPVDKLARWLAERQIDFDILPAERLAEAEAKEGRMALGMGAWRVLLVPAASYLPAETVAELRRWQRTVPVYVSGGSTAWNDFLPRWSPAEGLRSLRECGAVPFTADRFLPDLRVQSGTLDEARWLFVVNESAQPLATTLRGELPERAVCVDLLGGTVERMDAGDGLPLSLNRGEARLILCGEWSDARLKERFGRVLLPPLRGKPCARPRATTMRLRSHDGREQTVDLIHPAFVAANASALGKEGFPRDVNGLEGLARFSGHAAFPLRRQGSDGNLLKVCFRGDECVLRTARREEVRIQSPAFFRLEPDEEEWEVELCNTLASALADPLSRFAAVEPLGIESVELLSREEET